MKIYHSILSATLFTLVLGACSSDNGAPNGDVNGAKLYVGDVRTWNTTINNEVNSTNGATEFQTRVDVANQVFDSVGKVLNTGMSVALQAAAQAYQTKSEVLLSNYDSSTPFISSTGSATISGNTITVTGSVTSMTADLIPVQQTADVNLSFVFPDTIGTQFTASITGTSVGGGASLSITTGTVTFAYNSNTDLSPWLADPSLPNFPTYESASMALSVTLQEAGIADPVGFTGSISLTMVPVKDGNGNVVIETNGDVRYAVQSFSMSGDFGNTLNNFNATVGATIPNAGTYIEPVNGETADMYLQIQNATISFTATLDGLPTAKFIVTANRMTFDGTILQVEISYGVKVLTITFEQMPNDAKATFTVTDGVNTLTMVAFQSSGNGSIYYNGGLVGTISDDNGVTIITYVDGSIESLQ